MYVVTVKFQIKPEFIADFMPAMMQQASDSLTKEAACTQFDVCISENDQNLVYLYEIYNTKADFDFHLTTEHFQSFSAKVADWVADKQVETFLIQQ